MELLSVYSSTVNKQMSTGLKDVIAPDRNTRASGRRFQITNFFLLDSHEKIKKKNNIMKICTYENE